MPTLDLAKLSMQPPASFPELYQELWWYSGVIASTTSVGGTGSSCLLKGSTSVGASTASNAKLYTFSSTWPSSVKVAFEATLYTASGASVGASMWDMTSNVQVSASQISASSTTATVVRSSQFTLISGHQYGVEFHLGVSGTTAYCTDASLIIFPPAGSVSPSLSSISLANPSGGSLKEAYYGLWIYSSGTVSSTATASGGTTFIQKGSTALSTYSATPATLLPISSTWSASQKFALEASIYNGTSSDIAYAVLWDITSNVIVSSSQVSITATTATLIRSGSFTLTPGHKYGVCLWCNAGTAYLTKAHLVALSS